MHSRHAQGLAAALTVILGTAGFSACSTGSESASENATPACSAGQVRCDGTCVTLTSDPDHCGSCDRVCTSSEVCSDGSCASSCGANLTECGRACVVLDTDAAHCGRCDQICSATADCVSGRCVERPSGFGGASAGGSGQGGRGQAGQGQAGSRGGNAQGGSGTGGSTSAGGSGTGGSGTAGSGTGGSATGGSTTGGTGGSSAITDGGPPPDPPAATCAAPIALIDTSTPDQVVGTGTSASCTFEALETAVGQGGIITFDCGGSATIDVTAALQLRTDVDTTIDGGGVITLDGGRGSRQNRIFEFDSPKYRATSTTVTIQRITLQNAEAPASDYTPQDTNNPQCAWGYGDGQGGAIYVRDGILHVIDTTFSSNKAASPGPDTGGGAVYALGSQEVIVSGSTFYGNEGANGGAVGLLQSDGIFANTIFEANMATGTGQNSCCDAACPGIGHAQQLGAGGNGGAVVIDGDSVDRVSFCNVIFRNNQGNELGTVFRTPNVTEYRESTFDRCLFEGNSMGDGGGAIWMRNMHLVIKDSTFDSNTATGLGGGVRADDSTIDIQNTTFYGNSADHAIGGALVFTGQGLVKNCTFAENKAIGGYDPAITAAYFGAAISGGHDGSNRFVVENTVFLNNTDTHPYTPMTCNVPEPLDGSNNVQWPQKRVGEDGLPSGEDDNPCTAGILFADANLGPLADNGGATPTMVPQAGSPALGLGQDCPPYDQRGQPRPANGCAAGAVEP